MSTPKLEAGPARDVRRPRRARKTILVVEDEKLIRWTIREALRGDYRVRLATSAEAALEMLPRLDRLDGILADVQLPGMDGLTLCRQARTVRPDVKIFIMTAFHHETAPREAFGVHADAYLAKPFSLEMLRDMMASHLGGATR